jgi:CIC family chloride channel protein
LNPRNPHPKKAFAASKQRQFSVCLTAPLGSTQRVIVINTEGRYLGVAVTGEAFAADNQPEGDNGRTAADIARWPDQLLLPEMNIKQAVSVF